MAADASNMAPRGHDEPRGSLAPRARAALVRHPLLAIFLLCLCLWLPTLARLPPTDRDESRFAQATKQMLQTGDFIDIRFGKEARYNKPAGIYWLQAATTEIAGHDALNQIWTYRLASLLGGIAACWLAYWCGRAFLPPEPSLWAASLLAASLLLSVEASIATTDAVLLASILGAQGVLLRAYLARDGTSGLPGWQIAGGWAALGFGVLVKGPVAPAVVAVTAIAVVLWDRDARWLERLKPLSGIAIALAVAAPWLIAIGLKSHGDFFRASLGTDFGAKIAGERESHGAPPGYYAALATLTFFPGTLFLLPALRDAVSRVREPQIRFLLAWAAAVWLMFELVPTKLPHYILPVYPALALLCALWFWRGEGRRGWAAAGAVEFAIGLAAFALALVLLPSRFGSGASGLAWTMLTAATAAGVVAVFAALRRVQSRAVAAALVAAFGYYATVAIEAPTLTTLWVSPRLEDVVAANGQRGDPPPVAAGFTEPSLVFLVGTPTRLANGPVQAAFEAAAGGGLALVDDTVRPAFLARLGELGASAKDVGEVSGLNYSRGRSIHVTVYRITPRR